MLIEEKDRRKTKALENGVGTIGILERNEISTRHIAMTVECTFSFWQAHFGL